MLQSTATCTTTVEDHKLATSCWLHGAFLPCLYSKLSAPCAGVTFNNPAKKSLSWFSKAHGGVGSIIPGVSNFFHVHSDVQGTMYLLTGQQPGDRNCWYRLAFARWMPKHKPNGSLDLFLPADTNKKFVKTFVLEMEYPCKGAASQCWVPFYSGTNKMAATLAIYGTRMLFKMAATWDISGTWMLFRMAATLDIYGAWLLFKMAATLDIYGTWMFFETAATLDIHGTWTLFPWKLIMLQPDFSEPAWLRSWRFCALLQAKIFWSL